MFNFNSPITSHAKVLAITLVSLLLASHLSSVYAQAQLGSSTQVADAAQRDSYAKKTASDHANFTGIGRPATPKEISAWDIDVRPDFAGLPKGSGSVSKGSVVWENKCASCHGYFGESNEVFNPIAGGTSKADIQSGRVARLNDTGFPQRTTMMKLSTLSTLWDYINRAMPWNAPKSLTVDEVYAVTAYVLNLGGVVDDNFALSNANMAQTQALLPNRNGKSTSHGLWPGREFIGTKTAQQSTAYRPDVSAKRCMTDCGATPTVQSELPAYARDAHGNLADQNRLVGPQRGATTAKAAAASTASTANEAATTIVADFKKILDKNGCTGCHQVDGKLLGPSFKEISAKYSKQADGQTYLVNKIRKGGVGVWGSIPMPEQAIPENEALALARWIMQ